jgi:hypothetical protein
MHIRAMGPDEIALAVAWAAGEGWNPGLQDAGCFAPVDPDGFLIGEIDGAPAAVISCVNYDDRFSFLGFYIVREELRGRGYGLQIWNAACAHAGARTIGLDGVVAQQDKYRRSGFQLAYPNLRYGGRAVVERGENTVPISAVPFSAIDASDASVFPAPRPGFLRHWIAAPGHEGRAVLHDGVLAGWGVIRPARAGFKIGPLVAKDRRVAESVLAALVATSGGTEVFLDVPSVNRDAVAMAEAIGLMPVFETARMYNGPVPPRRIDHVFGVTSFELG